MQENYIVGIYARLSRDDERAGESVSIENQKEMLSRYVREQGWTLYDYYCDDGVSGTTFDRPGLNRLVQDATDHKINLVLCKDLSRLGRDYIEAGKYTDFVFPSLGCRFIALNDGVDTLRKNNEMLVILKNVMNDLYARDTSSKIKAVKLSTFKSGTVALFGGLLRCMDCGSSMRYMRDYRKKVSEKEPEYKAYVCNRYSSGGKNACSSHYINQKVLTQIVMTDIRCKAMWAQNSRETLRTQLLAREQSASVERTRTLQAELNAIGKRLPELDKLIQSAYEDKVLGRIPESVCVNLLNQYEAERREKQERRKELTEQLAARLETESSVDAWLDMMQDYAQLEELDHPTLVRLIQKIEISERYTVDDHEERDIHIYYNFVGYIEA
jgi:DNA invertase Pin-like site-specific DNA recombinase